jgi:predicted dehydrogenase
MVKTNPHYPVSLIVIGAGSRGTTYASYALQKPAQATVVAVAEPRQYQRQRFAIQHRLKPDAIYSDWKEIAAKDRFADAVIIATQDTLHKDPAMAFMDKGYDVLLEKPMAPTAEECRRIVESALKNKVIFAVCHVLRYTDYTQRLKSLLSEGVIGRVINIQHLEPVGYWHQAHSFVRGNWRKKADSTFMLLAKSCHDLDWIRYIMGAECTRVSSFGGLVHFREQERPAGAAECCTDCALESSCPYSAPKIYLGRVSNGETGWPVDVITDDVTEEGVLQALQQGPYGRCVYACDNDVVDHQVVNLEFANSCTASFTMTAFTEATHRRTRLFGTHGEIEGNGAEIDIFDFRRDEHSVIDVSTSDATILGGHGGGDARLIESFVRAVGERNSSLILSGPKETLETHMMVFAAEQSRIENRVVGIAELTGHSGHFEEKN